MKEIMRRVSHQQASQLLHNKFIVVLGDSIQRAVYKDLVLLLQKEKHLSTQQLRTKGEMSFEQDSLMEGGCLSEMHNRTEYREVRQFRSDHHLVRFYFVTRIYSRYMQSILEDLRRDLKPDIVIINSCVWDISRYCSQWINDYRENLHKFFGELKAILPEETLVVWNLTMPLAEKIKGGFLVPEIEHKAPQLRHDVIEANFYSGTLANAYNMDVLDLHYHFRFSLQHRTKDGVHWNALAHRRITSLLLQHAAQAWGVIMPCPLTTVEYNEVTDQKPTCGNATKPANKTSGVCRVRSASNYHYPPPNYFFNMVPHPSQGNYNGYREEFFSPALPCAYFPTHPPPPMYHHQASGACRPLLPPPPPPPRRKRRSKQGQFRNGFDYRPPHHFEPYNQHHHQYVMRSRHTRHHYAPYTHHGHYY